MLDPQQDRRQLFDALRPPAGYELDWAVGTTYSLDLLALLTVPLAYTLWGGEDTSGQSTRNPLAELHGIRQVADRLAIFCQAGQISVPRQSERLFTYLEETVFEVVPPHKDGVFHPKIWLLRFTPQPDPDAPKNRPILYRFLCLSRNLTFDHSWDTMLVLEGAYQEERRVAYGRNHPLGDFIQKLPEMAVRPVPETVQAAVDRMSQEVRKVDFETPPWATELEFIPMGLSGRRSWPFRQGLSRQLIVSPFITTGFLKDLSDQARQSILISRLESLEAAAPQALAPFADIYYLDPIAEPETVSEEEATGQGRGSETLPPASGLHAKLFISEYGRSRVELFTGSANATNAAFFQNVEFLVKFSGWGARIGIDKLLAPDKKGDKEVRLLDLLQPFEPQAAGEKPDNIQEKLEQMATRWQRQLARLPLAAVVSPQNEAAELDTATFDISLQRLPGAGEEEFSFQPPDNISIRCRPITRRAADAVPLTDSGDTLASIKGLSYPALTAFFAFSITATLGQDKYEATFVLNLPLINAPTDRREQVLRFLLDNRSKVMTYMLFLLAESHVTVAQMGQLFAGQEARGENGYQIMLPVDLFETMVQALYKNPGRLDQIQSLVSDLAAAGTADLLPEGFEEIWPPIWQARQQLRTDSKEKQRA